MNFDRIERWYFAPESNSGAGLRIGKSLKRLILNGDELVMIGRIQDWFGKFVFTHFSGHRIFGNSFFNSSNFKKTRGTKNGKLQHTTR